ncbi:DUF7737 domain-containing protein [Streptomyces sp. NPDC001617]
MASPGHRCQTPATSRRSQRSGPRCASGSRSNGKVFLPFEDDRLSLILSKAFLLAADTEITDESILMQIKRGV